MIENSHNQPLDLESKEKLTKTLKSRHLSMIAIGGAIGTGLFVATGASLSAAGPGGALAAYAAIGLMVYFLMTSLGEMATYMPVSGSFETYATRFVDPSFGFALGWNYWYNWAITVAVELTAASLIIKYWFPDSSTLLCSGVMLSFLFINNLISTRTYGEIEYWMAGVKVVMVLIFLVTGFLIITGLIGHEHAANSNSTLGFSNFFIGDAPFVGGFGAALSIFMVAGFSFQGTELVGIAAGESGCPEKDVPKAINTVFWRILLFYIGSILIIGCIVPYNDPHLLNINVQNLAVSPFTLVFSKAGLGHAASLVNFIVMLAVISCANSGTYASTRMLYSMAVNGKAPKVFTKLNKGGVPIYALLMTSSVGMLAFLASFYGDGTVFTWLLNASGMSGFVVWMGIAVSHYRFRKVYIAQGGRLEDLKFKAKFYPFGPLFALALCLIVIFGQNYRAFMGEVVDWNGVFVSYIGLPIFILIWIGHRICRKKKE